MSAVKICFKDEITDMADWVSNTIIENLTRSLEQALTEIQFLKDKLQMLKLLMLCSKRMVGSK